jgi:hypothetical protein
VARQLLTLARDYAALPLAGSPVYTRGERVKIDELPDSVAISVSTARVTELEIGTYRFFLDMTGNPFGYTAGLLGTPGHPCAGRTALPVRWRGFTPTSVTSDSLVFSELTGELDWRACTVESKTRLDARAAALIPRTLYAFRRGDAACEGGWSVDRRETLTVIAPPSEFVLASDAAPDDMTNAHVGSFAVSEIPVAPDRATSTSIVLSVAAFEQLPAAERRGVTPPGASGVEIKVDVEVLGPSPDDAAPLLTLHLSARAASAWEAHLRTPNGSPPARRSRAR